MGRGEEEAICRSRSVFLDFSLLTRTDAAGTGITPGSPATPRAKKGTAVSRKRVKGEEVDSGAEDITSPSTAKKRRASAKKTAVKEEDEDAAEFGAECNGSASPTKKRKSPTKKKSAVKVETADDEDAPENEA